MIDNQWTTAGDELVTKIEIFSTEFIGSDLTFLILWLHSLQCLSASNHYSFSSFVQIDRKISDRSS